jgi:ABC-type amino acid transport substrate-binding protein
VLWKGTRSTKPLFAKTSFSSQPVGNSPCTAEEYARKHLTRSLLTSYHFNTEAYSALTDSTLHAVLDDAPIAKGFEALLREVRVASTVDGTKSQYGIMFARGNDELRMIVNQALGALREDGTCDTLYRKWFT